MKRKELITLLCTCVTSILSGCAALNQPSDIAIVRGNGNHRMPVTEVARIPELSELHQLAALNAAIYVDSESGSTGSFDEFCRSEDIRYTPEGWHRLHMLPDFPETPPRSHKVSGMKYEVWVRESRGTPPRILIVFRGTDAEQLGDWFSNLRWITRLIPFFWDQYDQTRAFIPALVQHLREKYGDHVDIRTTGHSLGGGLAQQAAYMSKHIHKVYAFDPSTVTGYYGVEKTDREANEKGMSIYRVYEHGEILAYLRFLMKTLYPITTKDPKIIEIRYNLAKGNLISQHSMKDFACKLRAIAESSSGP